MATPKATPPPDFWHLAIDDVGEFLLVPLLSGERALEGGRLSVSEDLHRGAVWQWAPVRPEKGQAQSLTLEPGPVTLGSWSGQWQRPGEASPIGRLLIQSKDVPDGGVLFVPAGGTSGFSIGPGPLGFSVSGLEHPIQINVSPEGFHCECAGGVRMATGEGEFDGAQIKRALPWQVGERHSFWCQARPGAPVFVHLDPTWGQNWVPTP